MSEEQKPQPAMFAYRIITLNGMTADFYSPNVLEGMWTIIKGDGFFQMLNTEGKVARRIPFHAIASLEYHDPSAAALAYAPAASLPRA